LAVSFSFLADCSPYKLNWNFFFVALVVLTYLRFALEPPVARRTCSREDVPLAEVAGSFF